MKEFQLINGSKEINFNFPTSLKEISSEYLLGITKNVHVGENYSLVALAYHERLSAVIIARKQSKKNITGGVIPIFVKAGETINKFIHSAKCGDKLIIASSQLSLSHHVAVPKNPLSLDYFINILDHDVNIAKRYDNAYGGDECFFVDFKIVPNCDIVGFYDNEENKFDTSSYLNISEGA